MTALRTELFIGNEWRKPANGDRFLAYVKVGESRHERACVEVVHPLFEQADGHHLSVEMQEVERSTHGRNSRVG